MCPSSQFFRKERNFSLLRMSFQKIQYLSVVGKDVCMRLQHAMIIVGMLEGGSSSSSIDTIVDDVSCRCCCYTSRGTFLSSHFSFYAFHVLCVCIWRHRQSSFSYLHSFICVHLFLDSYICIFLCTCTSRNEF